MPEHIASLHPVQATARTVADIIRTAPDLHPGEVGITLFNKSRAAHHPKEETMKEERDIEKVYSNKDFVAKLRRLADAIENEKKFEIQIAGERIYVPVRAEFTIEHEREGVEEEIEFQIKWKNE